MPHVSSFCWSSFYFSFIHSLCLPHGLVPLCYIPWNRIPLWIYWLLSEDFTFVDGEVWSSNDPAAIQKHCYGDNVKEIEGRAPRLRPLTIQLGKRLNVLGKRLMTTYNLVQFNPVYLLGTFSVLVTVLGTSVEVIDRHGLILGDS